MIDEEKMAEFHELAKCFDARVDKRHELLHESIIEAPFLHSFPKLIFRDRFDEILLIDPIEFLDVKKSA